jgi:hypothetical protein
MPRATLGLAITRISGGSWSRPKRWVGYVRRPISWPATAAPVRGGIAGDAEAEVLYAKGSAVVRVASSVSGTPGVVLLEGCEIP